MGECYFNLETTKIELHFAKSDYDALSDLQKKELKSAFLFSGSRKAWVSRAKEPNLARPRAVAKKLGFTTEKRIGERLSFAEQVEAQTERAEARAERYEQYADNAANRGSAMQKAVNDMHGDIAFFTQPNVNTSAGRSFTNYRRQILDRYDKGFDEYRKSDYFKNRADTARETAAHGKFNDIAYLDRKIKECDKTIRKRRQNIEDYEKTLAAIENGEEKKRYNGEILTAEDMKQSISNELELIEKAIDQKGYLQNRLDELGGLRFNKDNIKPGYIVSVRTGGRNCEVLSAGPVNIKYRILSGGAAGFELTAAYAEILEIVSTEAKSPMTHPFKVGDEFKANKFFGGKYVEVIYRIIKATDKSVTLQAVDVDEKPIVRKPRLAFGGDSWRLSISDSYGNTFYRTVQPTQTTEEKTNADS